MNTLQATPLTRATRAHHPHTPPASTDPPTYPRHAAGRSSPYGGTRTMDGGPKRAAATSPGPAPSGAGAGSTPGGAAGGTPGGASGGGGAHAGGGAPSGGSGFPLEGTVCHRPRLFGRRCTAAPQRVYRWIPRHHGGSSDQCQRPYTRHASFSTRTALPMRCSQHLETMSAEPASTTSRSMARIGMLLSEQD